MTTVSAVRYDRQILSLSFGSVKGFGRKFIFVRLLVPLIWLADSMKSAFLCHWSGYRAAAERDPPIELYPPNGL
jgi:hypothetical protein